MWYRWWVCDICLMITRPARCRPINPIINVHVAAAVAEDHQRTNAVYLGAMKLVMVM